MIRILFQGDSITDGNRFKDAELRWDLNHQIGHSYAYIVAATLGRSYPGKYQFINRGIASDCVNKMAARWDTDTILEEPDVLSILAGINGNRNLDGYFAEGVEEHLANFEATYRSLIERARAHNPSLKLIILEPFYLPVGKRKATFDAFMKVFARKQAIIGRIAEDYGAVFIPIQKRLEELVESSAEILRSNGCNTDPNEYWLWDGIHPTEPMHGLIANLWLEAAKDIL